jgi:hypothetical protein
MVFFCVCFILNLSYYVIIEYLFTMSWNEAIISFNHDANMSTFNLTYYVNQDYLFDNKEGHY